MMIGFWLAAGLLLLLGYAFFIPAFIRQSNPETLPDRERVNLELHRQRQAELASEVTDSSERELLAEESARSLLGDLDSGIERHCAEPSAGRIPLIVTLCLLPMVILVAYLAVGRPDMIDGQSAQTATREIEASIQHLAERLKEHPDDVEGWMLLGRALEATRQFDKAAKAYEVALKLAPDNIDIKAIYAEALAEAQQGQLAGKPIELVQEILAQDPLNKTALWMAGIAAAERGNKQQAVDYWQRLKQQMPANSPDIRQIDTYIDQIQGQSEAAAVSRPTEEATRQASKRVQVAVSLAKELAGQSQPEDALFIFARAAEGPPMPLAVVRKKVKDLPLEVSLDDTMSMMPGMNLSSFEHIVLGARISKTGKPTASPGDLQGLSKPLVLENDKRYAVTIGQVVGKN